MDERAVHWGSALCRHSTWHVSVLCIVRVAAMPDLTKHDHSWMWSQLAVFTRLLFLGVLHSYLGARKARADLCMYTS